MKHKHENEACAVALMLVFHGDWVPERSLPSQLDVQALLDVGYVEREDIGYGVTFIGVTFEGFQAATSMWRILKLRRLHGV